MMLIQLSPRLARHLASRKNIDQAIQNAKNAGRFERIDTPVCRQTA